MSAGLRESLVDDILAGAAPGTDASPADANSRFIDHFQLGESTIPRVHEELWTARQRQGHSLHEISYRACFKAELPAFFIERLSSPGDIVFDPFMGRGTTLLEAALRGRIPWGNDINPLSRILVAPRLDPPQADDVSERLAEIPWDEGEKPSLDLTPFYHPSTLVQLTALRRYLLDKGTNLDSVDRWIQLVAITRLSGHSAGFFSVYTLPPNQAVSSEKQSELNARRKQVPPARDVAALIRKKSRALLRRITADDRIQLASAHAGSRLLCGPAGALAGLEPDSVHLTVTSPPFLDVVDYARDNWLRCWFAGLDPASIELTRTRRLEDWRNAMAVVLGELHRVTRPGGWVAFEVGEVRRGTVMLDEVIAPLAENVGFRCILIAVNSQDFSKTANCWGITNNRGGTNTNRVVLLRKEA